MKTTLKQREIAVLAYLAAKGVLSVDPVFKSCGANTVHRVSVRIAARALQGAVKKVVTEEECATEVVRWLILSNALPLRRESVHKEEQ